MEKIENPTDGENYVIENEMISNIPRGQKKPPEGEPWVLYLFGRRKRGRKKLMIIFSYPTKKDLDKNFSAFAEKAEVVG